MLQRGDPVRPDAIIVVATVLMAIGLVMVASTSASLSQPLLASPVLRTSFGRQAIFALAGFIVMLITSQAAMPILASPVVRRRISQIAFVIAVGLLIAALVPSLTSAHRGSHRWLRFAIAGIQIGVQPSELAKLAMVALLAALLTERNADPRSLRRGFVPASAVIGVSVLLVGKEDFGTSVLLAGVGAVILFVGGCRLRHLAVLGTLGTGAMIALLFAAPYRLERIIAYTGFWDEPRGSGYQPLQSLATIASGSWTGTGLGSGVQKYGYLPESRTDFIFAVICEELGLFGAALVIALFCVLVWLSLRIMLTARSRFERLLAFGLGATIGLQAAMNIAVVTVVTPTTGISLPLVSAGGSGLLTFCLATGVLAAIAARGHDQAGAFVTADDPAQHTMNWVKRKEAGTW